jgi:hypothetical protein
MLSVQELSTLRSLDMWRVGRKTSGLKLLAKHLDYTQTLVGFERNRVQAGNQLQSRTIVARWWTIYYAFSASPRMLTSQEIDAR